MHSWSMTSQRVTSVPPHGPLLICLGHVCGQTYSMWPSTQLPHAWQPNSGRLTAHSNRSASFASSGDDRPMRSTRRQPPPSHVSRVTGISCPALSSARETTPAAAAARVAGESSR